MNAARSGMGVAQILRILLLLVLLGLAGWLIFTIRGTLLPFAIAFVLSYVLMPLVDGMESRGLNRLVAVVIIYACTLAVFVLLFRLVVPILLSGLDDMKNRIVGEKGLWACAVVNLADGPILFDRCESTDPDFSLVSPGLPFVLPPHGRDTLTVVFTPGTGSSQRARLSLLAAQPEIGPVHLRVSGNTEEVSDETQGPALEVAVGSIQLAISDTVHHFGLVKPGFVTRMAMQIKDLQPQLVEAFPMLEGVDLAGQINERMRSWARDLLRGTPALVGSIISSITFVVIVPFVVFFFLSEGRRIKRAFIELIPNRYFEMVLNLLHRIDIQLGGYIRGLVLSVLIISLMSIAGLRIIGLRDYLVVGVLAGVANVIPYLGPIIGILAGVVAALLQYSALGAVLPVVVVFLVVQVLDNVFVSPVVVAKSVNLHPLVVIFVVLVGNQLFGPLGMLMAVPVTAVFKVSVQTIYEGLRSYSIT